MKVAIAQIHPALGEVKRNLAVHLDWIRRARAAGAELVVFPELSMTGYLLLDLVQEVAGDLRRSTEARKLAGRSRELGLIVGTAEVSEGYRYYNAAALYESGALRHVHRKVYLPTYGMFDEGRYFAAGDRFRVFESAALGRLGLLVCEDAWHLSSSYLLAQGGAEILCILSAGPVRGMSARSGRGSGTAWRELCQAIARFHTVHVLYCNRVGQEDGWTFSGGSMVVDPTGQIVTEAGSRDEELLVADLRPEKLREARMLYPLLRDERPHLVGRELGRILQQRADAPEVP